MSTTTTTPIWDSLTNKHGIEFDLPNDTANLHSSSFNSGFSSKSNVAIDEYKLNNILPLTNISIMNKIDLSDLLLTQYELSNLSCDKFINNCALLHELHTFCTDNNDNNSIQYNTLNIFRNFLKSYNKYICKPLPISYDQIPNTFKLYDDKIDIILQYMLQINHIINHNIINADNKQFDIYFVPPNETTDFDKFYMENIGYSGPDSRYSDVSGLDDVYSLFCSKEAHKLVNELHDNNKRLILLIIRGDEYNTNNDILYLFNKNMRTYDSDNSILNNINNRNDTICNKLLNNLFNISYHFKERCSANIYMYYNGYGERICKRSIVNKLPFIFTDLNNKNKINNYIYKQFMNDKNGFNDFMYNDVLYPFGKYLFGLKYERYQCNDIRKRLLNVPKSIVKSNTVQIREFNDPQNQLYYYLTWTCKMQVLDGEFSEYILRDNDCKEIAIFNSELHEKYSNSILYVVCKLNPQTSVNGKPKWSMYKLMTTYDIYTIYGISFDDLPIGSRHIHNYFQKEITKINLNLSSEIIPVRNWNKVRIVLSQKFKGDNKPNLKNYNLTYHIKKAIENIQSNKNNLSLIPILKIDSNLRKIICQPLIPVILHDKTIAVSYNTLHKKIVINAVFIDPIDIINKAALVDAYSATTYKYISNTGSRSSINTFEDIPDMSPMNKKSSTGSNISNISVHSLTDQSWIISQLQEQLNNALKRENMMVKMFTVLNYNNSPSSNANLTGSFSQLPSPLPSLPNPQLFSLSSSSLLNFNNYNNNNNNNNFYYNNQNPIVSINNTLPLLTQTHTSPMINPSFTNKFTNNTNKLTNISKNYTS